MYTPIRWKQRFQNFEKSYVVFQRRITAFNIDSENEANQMSLIQAFGVVIELSWKTLKDYLEHEGTLVNSPKQVLRQAYQFKIINIVIKGKDVTYSFAAKLKSHFEDDTYLPYFFDIVAYNTITSSELKEHIRLFGKTIHKI